MSHSKNLKVACRNFGFQILYKKTRTISASALKLPIQKCHFNFFSLDFTKKFWHIFTHASWRDDFFFPSVCYFFFFLFSALTNLKLKKKKKRRVNFNQRKEIPCVWYSIKNYPSQWLNTKYLFFSKRFEYFWKISPLLYTSKKIKIRK